MDWKGKEGRDPFTRRIRTVAECLAIHAHAARFKASQLFRSAAVSSPSSSFFHLLFLFVASRPARLPILARVPTAGRNPLTEHLFERAWNESIFSPCLPPGRGIGPVKNENRPTPIFLLYVILRAKERSLLGEVKMYRHALLRLKFGIEKFKEKIGREIEGFPRR